MGRHAAGFTLVELILAATVTALVAVSATLVLRGVTEADRRIARQAQVAGESRAAADTIASALRNAYRPTAENERLRLEGLDESAEGFPRDRLRFFTIGYAPVRVGQPESDVREVEFGVMDPGDGNPPTLVRRLDPTRNDGEDGGGVIERIATGVVAFNVTYHDGAEYRDEWPETMGWPTAVKFELVVAAEGAVGEPMAITRTVALAHGYSPAGSGGGNDATPTSEQPEAGAGQRQPAERGGVR